jgi:hypothetical protein
MRILSMLKGLMGTAVLLLATAPAYADAVLPDQLVVTVHNIPSTQTASEDPALEGSGQSYAIQLPADAFNQALLDRATAVVEPDGSISDLIGICRQCGPGHTMALAFLSDTTAGLQRTDFFGASPVFFLSGEPGPFDVSYYLTAGYTATFTSDVNAAVPLPAALPLFVSGLAGLGWLARRRRSQAAHA